MAFNTFKCNCLTPLHFKGLNFGHFVASKQLHGKKHYHPITLLAHVEENTNNLLETLESDHIN